MSGRKRHILVDTLGLLLAIVVHSASIQDREGAKLVLQRAQMHDRKRLQLIWADQAYSGEFVEWAEGEFNVEIAVVSRKPDQKGFEVLPRRWVVERTLAWLTRQRRLARDYERVVAHSEAFIYLAMIALMIRRPA